MIYLILLSEFDVSNVRLRHGNANVIVSPNKLLAQSLCLAVFLRFTGTFFSNSEWGQPKMY